MWLAISLFSLGAVSFDERIIRSTLAVLAMPPAIYSWHITTDERIKHLQFVGRHRAAIIVLIAASVFSIFAK